MKRESIIDGANATMQMLGLSDAIARGLSAAMQAEQAGHSFVALEAPEFPEFAGSSLADALHGAPDLHRIALSPSPEKPVGASCLLVLDQHRHLYLRRHWQAESAIASAIAARLKNWPIASLSPKPNTLLPAGEPELLAANALIAHGFALVTGGPGSGKTSAAAKLALAYLLHQKPGPQRVLLAAPTGKAAARLKSSFESQTAVLRTELSDTHPAVFASLAKAQALTLHRLLGYQPQQSRKPLFARRADSPIDADLVIIDEASMLSLELMQRLLDALHPQTALLLLGDAAQLPAVHCGRPFADLVEALAQHPAKPLAALTRQWRSQPKLAELAAQVRALKADSPNMLADCLAALEPYIGEPEAQNATLMRVLSCRVQAGSFDALMQAESPESAWLAGQSQRFLTPLRQGAQGQLALNDQLEALLLARFPRTVHLQGKQRFFAGKLFMATVNDPVLGLYNGDVLLAWPNSQGELWLWFEQDGELQNLAPALVKGLESAWIMTVHKAQGSEFDTVDMLLPSMNLLSHDQLFDNALLYTAITRARSTLRLHGDRQTLQHALSAKQTRNSGLMEKMHRAIGEAASNQSDAQALR